MPSRTQPSKSDDTAMAPETRPEPKLDEIRQRPPDVAPGEEVEPDPRLTFANERTLLAWKPERAGARRRRPGRRPST